MKTRKLKPAPLLFTIVFLLLNMASIYAHCDGIDGPVVKAAIKALEDKNVNYVLIWVNEKSEAEVVEAFQKTIQVRSLNLEVKNFADKYFFETVVRLHRSGEGEPYTGLKPAGRDLGEVIPAADLAITKNSFDPISSLLHKKNIPAAGTQKLFNEVIEKKNYEVNDVAAGRDFVKAYIQFLHNTEEIFASHYENEKEGVSKMELKIPESLKTEHEKLHQILFKATKENGEIGNAAKEVAKILHNHFVNEEKLAIPPLGLLYDLSNGKINDEMKFVLELTENLKKDLPHMLEEHKEIIKSLNKLDEAAKKQNKTEYVEFAESLRLHAKTEEEILYPAAILVGEFIKAKS